jgi:aminopeptidase N
MGIDQTRFAWMDEGWATMGEWYITHKIDTSITDEYGMDRVKKYNGTSADVPMIVQSTENKLSYYINSYPKPGLVYLYLKDMLGDELFRKAVGYYMKEWNGKHPLPWDFFNCINKASGMDLDWFWKSWFYDWGALDLGIKSVQGNKITVEMKGTKPVPVYLHVTFSDGSGQDLHQSALVWKDKKECTFTVTGKKEIVSVSLQHVYVPERNTGDNTWKKK